MRKEVTTTQMVTWLRMNENIPEAKKILDRYKKTFRLLPEDFKNAARLREQLEMKENGFTAPVPEGLYYKQATSTVYKVTAGAKQAEWRPSERTWWSKDADMVSLYRDIQNSVTIRLTPSLASEIGLKTGICCVCGKSLTTKKSMELGIGPNCYKELKKAEKENAESD